MPTEDDITYGFSREVAEQLYSGLGQRDYRNPIHEGVMPNNDRIVHFRSPSGGIPARSTLTMGSASCDIYTSSTSGVLSDSGTNETVYNMASSAFGNSTHGIAMRNNAGLLVAIVEDCG